MSSTSSEAVEVQIQKEAPKKSSGAGAVLPGLAAFVAFLALGLAIGGLATAISAWDEINKKDNTPPSPIPGFDASATIGNPSSNLEWTMTYPNGDAPPATGVPAGTTVNGFLTVPLDPNDPENSPKTKVRVSARLARIQPAKHALLVHCGGPGTGMGCRGDISPDPSPDSGPAPPASGFAQTEDFFDNFDIFAIDQRGVGRSVGPAGVPLKVNDEPEDFDWTVLIDGQPYVVGGKMQMDDGRDLYLRNPAPVDVAGGEYYRLSDFVNLTQYPCSYDAFDVELAELQDGDAGLLHAYKTMQETMRRCYDSFLWKFESGHNYLDYMSTSNLAHDLAALLNAVGRDKANLHGTSYGTYVMSTFASMYPNRVDKVVVDGNVDPDIVGAQDFVHLNSEAVVNAMFHYDQLVRNTNLATRDGPYEAVARVLQHAEAGMFKITPSGTPRGIDNRFPGGWTCRAHCMWSPMTNRHLQDNAYKGSAYWASGQIQPDVPGWVKTEKDVMLKDNAATTGDTAALSSFAEAQLGCGILTAGQTVWASGVCPNTLMGSANIWIWGASLGTRYPPHTLVGLAKELMLEYVNYLGKAEATMAPGFWPLLSPQRSVPSQINPGKDIPALVIGNLYDSQTPYEFTMRMRQKWAKGVAMTTDLMGHGLGTVRQLAPLADFGNPNFLADSGILRCDALLDLFMLAGIQPADGSGCRVKNRIGHDTDYSWCSPKCDYINPAMYPEANYSRI